MILVKELEDICNEPDTAICYRMVQWKNGYYRLIGGSCKDGDGRPASDVAYNDCCSNCGYHNTVPLVVLYK